MFQRDWRTSRARLSPGTLPQARRLVASDAPGSRDRDYWVYAPRRRLRRKVLERPGVVMVLHGCDQSVGSMVDATRFAEKAESRGQVVVFPYVTSWAPLPRRARNCWGFWIDAERRRGEGEVGDLRRILREVEAEFGTDPRRRYVTGLSSGGAMAVALAVAHGDAIRAVGAVAGLAYAETSAAVSTPAMPRAMRPWFLDEKIARTVPRLRTCPSLVGDMGVAREEAGSVHLVPLIVIQSDHDAVVQVENAMMLRDVWIASHGGDGDIAVRQEALRGAFGERRSYVDAQGRVIVETVFYDGRRDTPTHYWPGDSDDPPYADMTGPAATEALLDFFARHTL